MVSMAQEIIYKMKKNVKETYNYESKITKIALSDNGRLFYLGYEDGTVHAVDSSDLRKIDPVFQQGKITQSLMCGMVHYDKASSHPILDSLPQVLHFQGLVSKDPIWKTVMLIESEMQRTRGKCGTIVDRLTEVLFLQLLNRYVHENKEMTGFLAALRDKRIHKALTLIHLDPNFNWSIASLGERVGMSRATLVRHFQSSVGLAPMAYILNWRMMKAYNLIKYSNANLEQIAEQVGFASARTLSKAFQRQYTITPSELRCTV